jgi:hypothetical protein
LEGVRLQEVNVIGGYNGAVTREGERVTTDALLQVESSILEHLRMGTAVSVEKVLDQFEDRIAPADLRRAVWSLVAKGKLQLTADFSLVKSA